MLRKYSLSLILLCLGLLVVVSACGTTANGTTSTANAGHTPLASTAIAQPTTAPVTPTPGLTQQYTFIALDSGKTVTYAVTTRFSVSLDQQQYPEQNIQISCEPQNALGSITGAPSVAPPLYAVRYQTIEPGTCTIKNGSFILTVVIVQ
jgi:hypothetical protein